MHYRIILLACLVMCLCGGSANAAIIVNSFGPSLFDADAAAMDAAVGITGYTIEDFEDTTLVTGLSYELTDPSGGNFNALPNTMDVSSLPSGNDNNQWDGTNILLGNSNNNFPGEGVRANAVTFQIAGGATSFGIGLSNFQSLSTPANDFPITDHVLLVNGIDMGMIDSLPGWTPGRVRNAYLRIDATDSDSIDTVTFSNINQTSTVDLLIFDHVGISFVPEPSSFIIVLLAVLGCTGCLRQRPRC